MEENSYGPSPEAEVIVAECRESTRRLFQAGTPQDVELVLDEINQQLQRLKVAICPFADGAVDWLKGQMDQVHAESEKWRRELARRNA